MLENDKIPVAIYRIDCSLYEGFPFKDIVMDITSQMNKKRSANQNEWLPESVSFKEDEFEVELYSSYKVSRPTWQKFLKPALGKNSRLNKCLNTVYSFLCFIGYKEEIFLVTGGIGTFHSIDEFVSQHFGLDVLVRIIDKNSPVIRSIQDLGVTGVILGQNRYFREEQKLSDDDAFGKIYKEVKAELQQKILIKDFQFSKNALKRVKSGCLAKTSFKINKAISFEELVHLAKSFTKILKREPNFSLNKVSLIDKRKKWNRDLLKKLNEQFTKSLFEKFKGGESLDVDLSHKDFEKYFDASTYLLTINQTDNAEFYDAPTLLEVISKISKYGSLMYSDIEHFNQSLLQQKLSALDEDGNGLTSGSILQHLHGELFYENKSYFIVDEEWYQVESDFIQDLNTECADIINECWDEELLTYPFDLNKDEKEYNLLYLNNKQWLVLDTITPENIELCDLLYHEKSNVCLVHVKKGFDNSLRDLTSQIMIAAKLVNEDIRNGFKRIYVIEKSLKAKRAKDKSRILNVNNGEDSENELVEIMKSVQPRDICFCLAFVDTAKKDRSLKVNLNKFQSNIAKYFLIQLYRYLTALRFDLKIVQIKSNSF